jgi:hypothetical protein
MATAALQALPCVASYLLAAFRTRALETAGQLALRQRRPHPGKRVDEVMCAGLGLHCAGGQRSDGARCGLGAAGGGGLRAMRDEVRLSG